MTARQQNTVNRVASTHRRNCQQRYISDSMALADHAVHGLQSEGFTVERVVLGEGRPQIEISRERRCSLLGVPLVCNGQAGVRYQVNYRHCQVVWGE